MNDTVRRALPPLALVLLAAAGTMALHNKELAAFLDAAFEK